MLIEFVFFDNFVSHCDSERFHWVGVGIVVGAYHLVEVVDHVLFEVHHDCYNYKRDSTLNYMPFQSIYKYNQMQEDEFDEFEQATYSTSTTHAQNANSSLADFSPPIQTPSFNQDGLQSNNIQPFSTIPSNLNDLFPLDMQSSSKSEQVWPHLNKISSVQESTQNGLFLDFTKNSSMKEEKNHLQQQQFFNYSSLPVNPVQNMQFPTIVIESKESTVLAFQDNDYLLRLPSKNSKNIGEVNSSNMDVLNQNATNLFSWQITNSNPILYASNIKTEENKGQLNLMDSNSAVIQQAQPLQQLKMTIQLQNDAFQFEPQAKQSSKSVQSNNIFRFQETKQHPHLESQFINVNNVVQSEDMRKQSEQFVFEQKVQQVIEPKEEQRKQSQQFVFQKVQPNQNIAYQQQVSKEQQGEKEVDEFQIATQVQHTIHFSKVEPTYAPLAQQLAQQPAQQKTEPSKAEEEEDDDFGDFQQTTVNYEAQPASNPNIEDNTIHIKEEYLNSNQSEFYKAKEKQLQHFVNSLPDFSFLFAKAFAV